MQAMHTVCFGRRKQLFKSIKIKDGHQWQSTIDGSKANLLDMDNRIVRLANELPTFAIYETY